MNGYMNWICKAGKLVTYKIITGFSLKVYETGYNLKLYKAGYNLKVY